MKAQVESNHKTIQKEIEVDRFSPHIENCCGCGKFLEEGAAYKINFISTSYSGGSERPTYVCDKCFDVLFTLMQAIKQYKDEED